MQAFTTLTGTVAPLNRGDVDTDQIIPKQYLKTIHRTGLKEGLFADWRCRADGSPDPEFFTNQPRYQDASILLTGENFGCGSSREHAPWALLDYGIRSILAPSFADIFYNNCFQNGILPVVLTPQEIQTLFDRTDSQDIYQVTVDLSQQFVLLPEGERYAFTVDPFRKNCMIKGLDGIGLTLKHEAAISDYEARRRNEVPWLFQDQRT
ncbi:MAG: 3-isopropylmalate dehydratase small subunit [Nitrospirota bacterium]|nr:3-isopropylmalate dehydratase small subunit [Nitrospirota bacterium]MDX2420100.1 3-isopropylmalate dehydratase small subunit [Nitrospirota bacterium]